MSKTCTYNIKVNYANRNEKERKYTVNKKIDKRNPNRIGCRIHTKQIKQRARSNLAPKEVQR